MLVYNMYILVTTECEYNFSNLRSIRGLYKTLSIHLQNDTIFLNLLLEKLLFEDSYISSYITHNNYIHNDRLKI